MNSKMTLVMAAATLTLAFGSAVAAGDHAKHAGAAEAAAPMSTGEVRKVDVDQGKVTLKHGPIANLDMPAMTMVFRVAEPGMLKDLKAGDKIQFHAESASGGIVVTHIQK